jgi:endonuclease/exonuclease/phosphatase family metal-dependent hydrolase
MGSTPASANRSKVTIPPFPKPRSDFDYDLSVELRALRDHKKRRGVPGRSRDRLLLATWNVANFGVHERREKDHRLIAEVLGWFDLVALQEVADDVGGLYAVRDFLPRRYRLLISDTAGNEERAAFVYDTGKVALLELVGRLSIPAADLRHIKVPGVDQAFRGFDRTPYLAAFRAGSFRFVLANVHLFFGSDRSKDMERRALEAYAVGRWADLRRKDPHAYATDIIALGDFNLPKVEPGDPIYRALTRRGLVLPEHSTEVGGSSLGGHKHYDQVAFFPGTTQERNEGVAPFDFDNAVFAELWNPKRPGPFLTYTRYYLSDHRPLWAQFRI